MENSGNTPDESKILPEVISLMKIWQESQTEFTPDDLEYLRRTFKKLITDTFSGSFPGGEMDEKTWKSYRNYFLGHLKDCVQDGLFNKEALKLLCQLITPYQVKYLLKPHGESSADQKYIVSPNFAEELLKLSEKSSHPVLGYKFLTAATVRTINCSFDYLLKELNKRPEKAEKGSTDGHKSPIINHPHYPDLIKKGIPVADLFRRFPKQLFHYLKENPDHHSTNCLLLEIAAEMAPDDLGIVSTFCDLILKTNDGDIKLMKKGFDLFQKFTPFEDIRDTMTFCKLAKKIGENYALEPAFDEILPIAEKGDAKAATLLGSLASLLRDMNKMKLAMEINRPHAAMGDKFAAYIFGNLALMTGNKTDLTNAIAFNEPFANKDEKSKSLCWKLQKIIENF